jgi:hypothetical protein
MPPHHSPVRSMWAEAHGLRYEALCDLGEARRNPGAVMVMEADYGGQILATCPMRHVAASEIALNQLLCDLESITWGDGSLAKDAQPYDARIYYEVVPVGEGVAGGMGGGRAIDGLWVHDEIAELGLAGAIEDVLRGVSGRIPPPSVNPLRPFDSIPAAKQIPGARLLFTRLGHGWAGAFLSCDVGRINCGEEGLAGLLHDLGLIVEGQANQVKWSRIYNLDVSRYQVFDGVTRVYNNSNGSMVLYVSPTGSGLHPGLRSDGPRPPIWVGGRLDPMGLLGPVCDVLDGRSPRIELSHLRKR